MWIAKPNYDKAQFKRLYRIHRQIKNPAWKGNKLDNCLFNKIFNSRLDLDEIDKIQLRLKKNNVIPSQETIKSDDEFFNEVVGNDEE